MHLMLAILTPFCGAALTLWISGHGRKWATLCALGVCLLAASWLAPLALEAFDGGTRIQRQPWIPTVNIDLVLRFDGLGLLFAQMVLGIGALVIIYAFYYLAQEDSLGRLYALVLLFMGAMLGVVLAEHLIVLLVFWELTSLTSFLLIAYWRRNAEARRGALMALVITGAGGLALLAGFVLLGQAAGSFELTTILQRGDAIRTAETYPLILLLILLGALTKSAQFPFHFWLPHAMSAPTPVSAYLHSATMVKAGVFLLARLFPVLSGPLLWSWWVGGIGLVTLLLGAMIALFKHDLKGLLAYSTISHLGLIVALFGIGTPLAAVAGVFHLINHAIFKAGLFMSVGIIDHECGTRDMRRINGLWRAMPHTAILAMVAAAAMAGVPLANGFLSKEMFFAEAVSAGGQMRFSWLLPSIVTLAGIFAVAYSLRFIHDVFFNGAPINLPKTPHEPPRFMKVPVEILVLMCLLIGIVPQYTVEPILVAAASAVLQGPLPDHNLAIWHGFNPALFMSLIAFVGGLLVYLGRQPLFALHERLERRLAGEKIFAVLMRCLLAGAERFTRSVDRRSLQQQLSLLLGVALSLGAAGLLAGPELFTRRPSMLPMDAVSLVMGLVLAAAALRATIGHRQRLSALILTGGVGLILALVFVKFSAPDLALTQLAVEVVTLILLLLALYFLPQTSPRESSPARRWRDGLLAVLAGTGMSLLSFAVLTRKSTTISDYYVANSVNGGGGNNVVNVILVDFRGFDTLGEISVLAIAALGIFALMQNLKLTGQTRDVEGHPFDSDKHPLIMATFSRLLLPLALLFSVYIFLRGHHLPGGGFIAGLVTAIALILQYITNGVVWTRQRLPAAQTHPLVAMGLLTALMTGLGSWLFGRPFLTSAFGHWTLPLIGEIELASAMIFDLGVYLVVVGATLLILINLGLFKSSTTTRGQKTWKS